MQHNGIESNFCIKNEKTAIKVLLLCEKTSDLYARAYNYILKLNICEFYNQIGEIINIDDDLSNEDFLKRVPNLFGESDFSVEDIQRNIQKLSKYFYQNKQVISVVDDDVLLTYLCDLLKTDLENYISDFIISYILYSLYVYSDKIFINEMKQLIEVVLRVLCDKSPLLAEDQLFLDKLYVPMLELRKLLQSSDRSERLRGRSIAEFIGVPLQLDTMMGLSIDGFSGSNDDGAGAMLVIGETGSGKSTTINYLNGATYTRGGHGRTIYLECIEPAAVMAPEGHGFNSKTTYSQRYGQFIDTAGFYDNRIGDKRVCAAIGPALAIHQVENLKGAMLVLPYDIFRQLDRGSQFRELCILLESMIGETAADLYMDQEKYPVCPLVFVFTNPDTGLLRSNENYEVFRTRLKKLVSNIIKDNEEMFEVDLLQHEREYREYIRRLESLDSCICGFNSESAEIKWHLINSVAQAAGQVMHILSNWKKNIMGVIDRKGTHVEEEHRWELSQAVDVMRKSKPEDFDDVYKDKINIFEENREYLQQLIREKGRILSLIRAEKWLLNIFFQRQDNMFFITGYCQELTRSIGSIDSVPSARKKVNGDSQRLGQLASEKSFQCRKPEQDIVQWTVHDHREQLLSYIEKLDQQKNYLSKDKFIFDMHERRFKSVVNWINGHVIACNKLFEEFFKKVGDVSRVQNKIKYSGGKLLTNFSDFKNIFGSTVASLEQSLQLNMLEQTIARKEEELRRDKARVEEINKEIDDLKDEKETIIGGPLREYQSYIHNEASSYWRAEWRSSQYSYTGDAVIERVELSDVVNAERQLLFKSNILEADNSDAHSVCCVDNSLNVEPAHVESRGVSHLRDILSYYSSPVTEAKITQVITDSNASGTRKIAGKFHIHQSSLDRMQFDVTYVAYSNEMYFGIRVFVKSKNLPENRWRLEEIEGLQMGHRLVLDELQKNITELEVSIAQDYVYLDLMKIGFPDAKNRYARIMSQWEAIGSPASLHIDNLLQKLTKPMRVWLCSKNNIQKLFVLKVMPGEKIAVSKAEYVEAVVRRLFNMKIIDFQLILGEQWIIDDVSSDYLSADYDAESFIETVPEGLPDILIEYATAHGVNIQMVIGMLQKLESNDLFVGSICHDLISDLKDLQYQKVCYEMLKDELVKRGDAMGHVMSIIPIFKNVDSHSGMISFKDFYNKYDNFCKSQEKNITETFAQYLDDIDEELIRKEDKLLMIREAVSNLSALTNDEWEQKTKNSVKEDEILARMYDQSVRVYIEASLDAKVTEPNIKQHYFVLPTYDAGNKAIQAIILAYLMPVSKSPRAFKSRFAKLFGNEEYLYDKKYYNLFRYYDPLNKQFADFLTNEEFHQKFVDRVVDSMSCHEDYAESDSSVDDNKSNMLSDSCWLDSNNICMTALKKLLNVEIIIMNDEMVAMSCLDALCIYQNSLDVLVSREQVGKTAIEFEEEIITTDEDAVVVTELEVSGDVIKLLKEPYVEQEGCVSHNQVQSLSFAKKEDEFKSDYEVDHNTASDVEQQKSVELRVAAKAVAETDMAVDGENVIKPLKGIRVEQVDDIRKKKDRVKSTYMACDTENADATSYDAKEHYTSLPMFSKVWHLFKEGMNSCGRGIKHCFSYLINLFLNIKNFFVSRMPSFKGVFSDRESVGSNSIVSSDGSDNIVVRHKEPSARIISEPYLRFS